MFKLQQKRKEEEEEKKKGASKPPYSKQMSVRSRFLTQEVSEIQTNLPRSCKIKFDDIDNLRQFTLIVSPDEGFWKGGTFVFDIKVPPEYNIKPPTALCKTRIWHPNITEDGKICLSILREHSLDGCGWLPTRSLKDVVWGLNSLFTDLVDFDDPLNTEAAEQYQMNKKSFERKVRDFVQQYAQSWCHAQRTRVVSFEIKNF